MSRSEMDRLGIPHVGHSWGRPGKDKELEDYICCGFVPHWGMLRQEAEPAPVLELTTDLIWRVGTIFCPGNSASNEYSLDLLRDNNTVEVFDSMFDNPNTSFPTPYQCEVMVYKAISIRHLMAVHCQTDPIMEQVAATINGVAIPAELHDVLPIKVAMSPWFYPPTR